MYALNTEAETGRILSACVVLPGGDYDRMPSVDALPDGNIYDYRYENSEYVYDPLPKPEQPAPDNDATLLDELDTAYQEGVNSAYDQ